MEVFINRRSVETEESTTLAELLAREGLPREGIAVAVNNKVVPHSEWPTASLQEGAKITVIRAVCGG